MEILFSDTFGPLEINCLYLQYFVVTYRNSNKLFSVHHKMELKIVQLLNIFILSTAFLVIFTGFNTLSDIQTLIFDSARTPDSSGYVQVWSSNILNVL